MLRLILPPLVGEGARREDGGYLHLALFPFSPIPLAVAWGLPP